MTDTTTQQTTTRSRRWYRQGALVAGLAVLALIALATLLGPVLLPYGPNDIDLAQLERPPSTDHLLGTDELGRDVLARLLAGGRLSVLVGLAAALVQLVVGVTIGAVSGYVGGWVDATLMRITEVFMCFPFYSIAVTLAGLFGASIWNVVLIIGLLSWTGLARLVRAEVLSLREREFVLFARASGVPGLRIITRHLLRNTTGPILVNGTLAVAGAVLAEAALSFLGLGVKQPDPSWGNMLSAAQSMRVLSYEWWLWIPPGIAIVAMVLAVYLVGDGLAALLNPRPHAPLRDLVLGRRRTAASSRRPHFVKRRLTAPGRSSTAPGPTPTRADRGAEASAVVPVPDGTVDTAPVPPSPAHPLPVPPAATHREDVSHV